MITIYKGRKLPKGRKVERFNDMFFNRFTVEEIDDRAAAIIFAIDRSELISKYLIKSRFDKAALNIDRLSTGCKTALNIFYNPDIIFDIRECGENALDVIYAFSEGQIHCDYPMISFSVLTARVYDKGTYREISSYDELKEWWTGED